MRVRHLTQRSPANGPFVLASTMLDYPCIVHVMPISFHYILFANMVEMISEHERNSNQYRCVVDEIMKCSKCLYKCMK